MEKIKDDNNSIDVFINNIDFYINDFIESHNIDMATAPASQFNAALMYTQKHVFSDKSILKDDNAIKNPISGIYTTHNKYNYVLIDYIVDYYIYLCALYNKIPSIYSFSYLVGINEDVIYNWGYDNKPTSASYGIYKKLMSKRESNLADRLTDSKNNSIGTLAVLNHVFGWNLPAANNGQIESRDADTIAAKYTPLLSQDDTQNSK